MGRLGSDSARPLLCSPGGSSAVGQSDRQTQREQLWEQESLAPVKLLVQCWGKVAPSVVLYHSHFPPSVEGQFPGTEGLGAERRTWVRAPRSSVCLGSLHQPALLPQHWAQIPKAAP